MRKRRGFVSAVLTIAALAFAVALAEGTLRIFGWFPPSSVYLLPPHARQRDRQTEWDLTYEASSLGLRDVEHALRREGSTFRVVLVGDSFTFGQGVERDDCFAVKLGAILSDRGVPAETINVSNAGIGADGYRVLVRDVALRFDPDVVVVNVFGNDASARARGSAPRRWLRARSQSSHVLSLLRLFRSRMAVRETSEIASEPERFWAVLEERCAERQPAERCGSMAREFRTRHGERINNTAACCLMDPEDVRRWVETDAGSAGWHDFREDVVRMRDLCAENGTPLVVGIVPDGVQVDRGQLALRRSLGVAYPDAVLTGEGSFQRSVRDLCAELRIPCYDPLPELRAQPDGLYFASDLHWTPEGHRRYAVGLADFLEREGLVVGRHASPGASRAAEP
jgi:lysophospholipase L1-like esterase